jgi:hypothetical protein
MNPGRRAFTRLAAGACALPGPSLRAAGGASARYTPRPRLGINLPAPTDWNTELPFVDVFHLSRAWIVRRDGSGAGQPPGQHGDDGRGLELDGDGWVKRLAPGTWAETPLCGIGGVDRAPPGEWTVLYDGAGALEMWGEVDTVSDSPGRLVFRPRPGGKGGFFLRVRRVQPGDHPRRLRVIMPGHAASYRRQPWNPSFLRRWRGVAAVRFMDFARTNSSPVVRWADRPRPEQASFAQHGVPAEHLVDLANRLAADPWFCMPHAADDDYLRRFAELVQRRLDPRRRVYVEYSNEVWNGMFAQNRHAIARGRALGLADTDWSCCVRYWAERSQQLFAIWRGVLGDRLVRVVATQVANPDVARQLLGWRGLGGGFDALAVAGYLGLSPTPHSRPSSDEVASWSLARLFDHLETIELPKVERWLAAHRRLAEAAGAALVAYEGGQHLVGMAGAENDGALTRLFIAANRHPHMGDLYRRLYGAWEAAGGDLFCHYSSVTSYTKWGSWGLLEQHDQDPASSPKFLASMRWAAARGQAVAAGGGH